MWRHQGPEEDQLLQPTFGACHGHQQPSLPLSPSPLHTNLPFCRFAPRVLSTGFILLLPSLCFCHSPYPESPPSSLTSAEPTSIAEGLIQTLPFQGSPALALSSNGAFCLYQSLGILAVLLCNSVCEREIGLEIDVTYCHNNAKSQTVTKSPWYAALSLQRLESCDEEPRSAGSLYTQQKKQVIFTWSLQKEQSSADTFLVAPQDPLETSDIHNSNIISVCGFEPLKCSSLLKHQ